MDRGRLTALKDAITDKKFAQCWSLDSAGNWRKFTEDNNGDGAWELDQLRTANKVNEITELSEYVGAAWTTPAYNPAGNMTTIPKPSDPTSSFTATYDAWNMLVTLQDGSATVAQYEYDGAKRRTVKKYYLGGVLAETRHFYYTEPTKWQVIEERVDSDTNPNRQFVWGKRYVDDLVLRDRDSDADGVFDERLYAMQDANWNVSGIMDSSGVVQERYDYAAYGQSTALTPTFGVRGASQNDWETRFAGYGVEMPIGLYSVRNRMFAPHLGSWIQRDSFKEVLAVNSYAYVGARPSQLTDPLGLVPFSRCSLYFLTLAGDQTGTFGDGRWICLYLCECPNDGNWAQSSRTILAYDYAAAQAECRALAESWDMLYEGMLHCTDDSGPPRDPRPVPDPVPRTVPHVEPVYRPERPRPYDPQPIWDPKLACGRWEWRPVTVNQWVYVMGAWVLMLVVVMVLVFVYVVYAPGPLKLAPLAIPALGL